MNENKFLKNLNQKPPSSPTIPAAGNPALPSAPGGYDPIQRLVDELSRQNTAMEGFNKRFDQWERQPRGATPGELQTLLADARKGVRLQVDSATLADQLVPALLEGMPTLANLTAAIDQGINQLEATGQSVANRIEEVSDRAVNRIEWASRRKADVLASRIGFSSWQSAGLVFTGFLVLVVGALLANQQREAALAQARTETQAMRAFTDWVKSQPEGKRLYDRYYHP